jgi:hypothetical protein
LFASLTTLLTQYGIGVHGREGCGERERENGISHYLDYQRAIVALSGHVELLIVKQAFEQGERKLFARVKGFSRDAVGFEE